MERPPLGSILRAVEVPPAGGDTLFSDQEAAFDALSHSLKEYLLTLTAVHSGADQFKAALEYVGEGAWEGRPIEALKPVVHPVVRTHPETGRRSLFVNPGFTSHIVELNRAESNALLNYLYDHSVQPEFTVRYHWHAGDIGFWDNPAPSDPAGDLEGRRAGLSHQAHRRPDEQRASAALGRRTRSAA